MTDIQSQWLSEYLGCIIRESRHYWGLNMWCPKEIMFQSGKLSWIEYLFEQELPDISDGQVTVGNVGDDVIALKANEDILDDCTDIKPDDPEVGRIIMPKGTVIFNIRIPFPDIPEGETKKSLNNLLNNGEVIKWMAHDLNECSHHGYNLKLSCLTTESALVECEHNSMLHQ